MAEFYWVGGSTATSGSYTEGLGGVGLTGTSNLTWVRAFDWNNPTNWYEKSNGWYPGTYIWTVATRCPSTQPTSATTAVPDIAIFASSLFGVTAGFTGSQLPRAKAPCLWGGASLSGATISWIGGGAGASTVTYANANIQGGLANLVIDTSGGRSGDSVYGLAQYPFSFIGLPNGLTAAADGGNEFSALYDASAKGFTLTESVWGGASWESLVAAVVATGGTSRFGQLRIRTDKVETKYQYSSADPFDVATFGEVVNSAATSRKNLGKVTLDLIKSVGILQGSSAGATASVVNTYLDLRGQAEYTIKGYAYNISRFNGNNSALLGATEYAPRPTLGLVGCTAVNVYVSGIVGSMRFDPTSNVAFCSVYPETDKIFLQFENKFDAASVWAECLNIGNTGVGNSGALQPNLIVQSPGSTVATLPLYNGVFFGGGGQEFFANWVRVGSAGSNKRTKAFFAGDSRLNRMEAKNSLVAASTVLPMGSDDEVKISELFLAEGSTLDFSYNTGFDGWKFGKQDGYSIVGGIIFEDETSIIKGSQGVRLFNDQLILGAAQSSAGSKYGGSKANPSPTLVAE